MPRLWHLSKPLVVGLPLVLLLGIGMGMLVYGLGMPSDPPPVPPTSIDNYSYYNAWSSARSEQGERAEVMGIGAGLLTAGLTTAVLYLIRFVRREYGTSARGGAPAAAPPPGVPSV
jgi:hypothetical protein